MEKKHRFLGFLSICVFCIFALMAGAGAVECDAGTYLDGDECASCPPEYPDSEAGATSINQCFISYTNEKCEKGTCPENSRSCLWRTSGRVTGKDYYGLPTNKTCAINILTCNSGYYGTDDKLTCKLCSEIPGFEGIYSGSGGGNITTCYQNCTTSCLYSECPEHAVCSYEPFDIPGGVFYDGNPYDAKKCKPISTVYCDMRVTCVDTGYTTFDPNNVKCDANTLTINYDANYDGTDEVSSATCVYDSACSAAAADTFSRENWEFVGWNTVADGTGVAYAAGADITNIISDGEITLYAQWNQLSTPCVAGKYYDGTAQIPCPADSFCPGVGDAPTGQAGCAVPCPDGGKSDGGASLQSQCYVECAAPAEIRNGTLSHVNALEYNDGESDVYPTCTYHATCADGFVAQNDNSVAPNCVWENPDNCPAGFYCPDDSDEPIACPRIKDDDVSPRGTSVRGTRSVTGCYYIFAPWDSFKNGSASGRCKYTDDVARYSACNLERAFSCQPGYYHLTEQTVGCTGVQQGYYSDGTTETCLADNYTDAACIASLAQKPCPEKSINPTVASAEYATSVTQCSKECIKSDPHGTVSRKSERVNAINNETYAACEYTVTCDTGYAPADNGTENARCVAREYTINLDKNGGAGDTPDSIRCTFDSGVCDLPSSVGLTRDGYSLVPQWCSNPSGGGVCHTAGTRVTTNISSDGTDVTLYAVWAPNVYEITLQDNDATDAVVPARVYLKYGVAWFTDADAQTQIKNLTNVPTMTGYNFSGFFDSAKVLRIIGSDGAFVMSDLALTFTTKNTSIYAGWAAGLTECATGTYYGGTGASCMPCKENHYCAGGKFETDRGVDGMTPCPNGGLAPGGAGASSACYRTGLPYAATYGTGTQTCYYDALAQTYSDKCVDQEINSCRAGYWLDIDKTATDCSPVGDMYYSAGGGLGRVPCPTEDSLTGHTGKDNATSESECYLENRVYDLQNGGALYGRGTQTCYFNVGASKYNDRCLRDSIQITYCNAGYWFDVTQNQYDCVPVGVDAYSEIGDTARHGCPAPGGADSGVPNTRGVTTSGSATDCFLTRELTTALHGRGHWGCFYNDNPAVMDYTNCSNPEMYQCDAGYYYKSSVMANDCIPVGRGNYSPDLDTALHNCPLGGYTLGETAANSTDCLMDNLACVVSNGLGTQTCSFNGTDAYDRCDCTDGCTMCGVTGCDAGYSLVANACIMCPADNVCRDGAQNTCAALTGGDYTNSDVGTTDVARCWRECVRVANAAQMTGRDYYGDTDTCAISQCDAGYVLSGGACVACPAGSYCDGTAPGDVNGKLCKTLGDGSWNLSESGASSAAQCYKECRRHTVINGTAIPVARRAYWDSDCQYRGISTDGNDCDIIDGVCVETSCSNTFEMIDGRCRPCAREHAMSYAADGNCVVASCTLGYHVENGECVSDRLECTAENATSAHRVWDARAGEFGTCTVTECDDGYHIASNACVSDVRDCDIENGHGTQTWNHATRTWGECVATSCDAGYTTDRSLTNENWKQCGQCRNKFSVRGDVAVSTYIQECEIGACLYQGELYNLENNECVPICDVDGYEDETGTMKWNASTHKCDRECKTGYIMW